MVPFSFGLGPQRGCQIAPPIIKYLKYNSQVKYVIVKKPHTWKLEVSLPCKYISSPSPNGSPHLAHLAHVGWK